MFIVVVALEALLLLSRQAPLQTPQFSHHILPLVPPCPAPLKHTSHFPTSSPGPSVVTNLARAPLGAYASEERARDPSDVGLREAQVQVLRSEDPVWRQNRHSIPRDCLSSWRMWSELLILSSFWCERLGMHWQGAPGSGRSTGFR